MRLPNPPYIGPKNLSLPESVISKPSLQLRFSGPGGQTELGNLAVRPCQTWTWVKS